LALAVIAILDAYRNAATGGVARYNRWYFYLAAWLVGYVIVGSAIFDYGRTNYMEAFKIPTGSMEPAVLKGTVCWLTRRPIAGWHRKRATSSYLFTRRPQQDVYQESRSPAGETVALADARRKRCLTARYPCSATTGKTVSTAGTLVSFRSATS